MGKSASTFNSSRVQRPLVVLRLQSTLFMVFVLSEFKKLRNRGPAEARCVPWRSAAAGRAAPGSGKMRPVGFRAFFKDESREERRWRCGASKSDLN
ncbi:hypothetical protein Zmor_012786 [Zophobas morio]|uniref:Uncharacterized protein n=1 Tax=Zophobas morio TaxID=2755281 RepID=A0AA38ME28_9CUCU|nr:hypothetical protein Zmor_012786 [Zophobas morio]